MKILLRILFVLLFIVLGIMLAGLFLPNKHQIVVKKQIDVPRKIVFGLVNDFSQWNSWSPWMQNDSLMEVSIDNPPSGKNAEMEWKSTIYGNCKATITHSVLPESVAVNFDFGTKSKTISMWYFEPTDEGTLLNWTLNLTHLNLWERYFLLFNKDKMNALIENGAENIDKISRSFSRSRIGEIKVIQFDAQPTILMVDSVLPVQVSSRLNEMNTYLENFFAKRNLTIDGNPFALIYGSVNDSLVKIASALPIAGRTWVWKTISFYEMPATKVVSVSHFGFPTDKAHRAILKYIDQNKMDNNGAPYEEYLYDARKNTDTANWETKVYYPVK